MASDLISGKALVEAMTKWARENFSTDDEYGHILQGMEKVLDLIEEQPTVDAVEVVHARWKGTGFGDYQCSWCGEVVSGCKDNYCRECGSKMDGGDE